MWFIITRVETSHVEIIGEFVFCRSLDFWAAVNAKSSGVAI